MTVVERIDEAAARRREAARALLQQRTESPDIRDWLPDSVVVVLTEDEVGATFEHLAQHHPDGGHLVRVVGESRIEVVEVRRCDAREFAREMDAEETKIHPEAEIGMLFDYLRSFPGRRLHCIAARPEYEVAIADDGGFSDLLVPSS